MVADRKCTRSRKPSEKSVRCNSQLCPGNWVAGEWGTCSASCGEGIQKRRVTCRQNQAIGHSIPVRDNYCEGSHNLATQKKCNVRACKQNIRYIYQNIRQKDSKIRNSQNHSLSSKSENVFEKTDTYSATWIAQPWGACSVTCGSGIKERRVS